MSTAIITITILRNFKREVLPAIELNMDGETWAQVGLESQEKLDKWLKSAREFPNEALASCVFGAECENWTIGVRVESIEGKLI